MAIIRRIETSRCCIPHVTWPSWPSAPYSGARIRHLARDGGPLRYHQNTDHGPLDPEIRLIRVPMSIQRHPSPLSQPLSQLIIPLPTSRASSCCCLVLHLCLVNINIAHLIRIPVRPACVPLLPASKSNILSLPPRRPFSTPRKGSLSTNRSSLGTFRAQCRQGCGGSGIVLAADCAPVPPPASWTKRLQPAQEGLALLTAPAPASHRQ